MGTVTYKVIDTRTNEDITAKYDWVMQPNGRLAYNEYGDLIGLTHTEAVFNIDNKEQKTGTWKLGSYGFGTCSVCNFTQASVYDQDTYQRYCGHCGAKMSLEE